MPAKKGAAFPKADAAATAFFRQLVPDAAGVATKPMFGHTAAFVNGTMFMGVFGDRVLVRLPEPERAALMKDEGAEPFEPMPGRPMREYVLLPPDWIDEPSRAEPWVARALAYAAALPVKAKKVVKRRSAKA